jgi:endonuclease-3
MPERMDLAWVLDRLAAVYGEPAALPARSVFEWLVYENVAYLVDDARREAAFARLGAQVGVSPEALLAASDAALRDPAGVGILAENQLGKLRRIAALALRDDLDSLDARPLPEAKQVLKRYPSIGEPGAEKILLFARAHAVLGLDSNCVRVLTRLGLVSEGRSYAQTYRQVQRHAEPYRERGVDWLIRAHQLLRQHGQELCRRSRPLCERCPLTSRCRYYAEATAAPSAAPSADQVSPR